MFVLVLSDLLRCENKGMTLTRKPLPLIDPTRLPHTAMRSAETYLKRQTFKVENALVVRLQALYWAAYRDLSQYVTDPQPHAVAEVQIAARIERLKADTLALIASTTRAAQLGGYFGKLWLMDVSTLPSVHVQMHSVLTEAIVPTPRENRSFLAGLLGAPFLAKLSLEFDSLKIDVRRVLLAIGAAGTTLAILRRLRAVMGVEQAIKTFQGNFNRIQVLARTAVQNAMDKGALRAMQDNPNLVIGLEWLTARDERVCPICFELDGRQLTLQARLRPPIHYHCRCTLIPIMKVTDLEDPERVLRQKFPAWLAAHGLDATLRDFLNS